MELKKLSIWVLLGLSANLAWADEDTLMPTPNAISDSDLEQSENSEMSYSSSASETIPEPIGMPKPRPHSHKQKVSSHRSPVYEVVKQPCYSYGCRGGYGQENGYQPWPPRGNRFVPYPQGGGYESRRRGPYPPPPEYYPDGYYGPREPDYGYGPRGRPMYPQSQGRFSDYSEYNQPSFGSRFLG